MASYNAQDKYNQDEGFTGLYGKRFAGSEKFNNIGSRGEGALGTHEAAQALRYMGRNAMETGRQIKEGVQGAINSFYSGAPLRSDLGDQAVEPAPQANAQRAVPKAVPGAPTALDRMIGDEAQSKVPTYQDGYVPGKSAGYDYAFDRKLAEHDQFNAANNARLAALPTQAAGGSDSLNAVRDYIKQISKVKVDPSTQSLGEMAAAVAERRQNARNLSTLTDLAKSEYETGANSREKALDRQSQLDQISATGAENRATKEFDEGLDSTKAATGYHNAASKKLGVDTDAAAFEASRKGKVAALLDQIAAAQARNAPPAEIAALQRQYATQAEKDVKTPLDTEKDLSEMYAKQVPDMQKSALPYATWKKMNGFADGGAVAALGYADGGSIPAPYGETMAMPAATPFINEYRRYAMMTQRLGATPVDMEQFAYLRGAAKRAQALQPGMGSPQEGSQMGMQGFADGGMIDAMAAELETGAGVNNPLLQRQQAVQGYAGGGWIDPMVNAVGRVGMAATEAGYPLYRGVQNVGSAIGQGIYNATHPTQAPAAPAAAAPTGWRDPALNFEGRMRQRQQQYGFADGGAIPVAGRQVLGPGTGTSDSIPAIIDGEQPAALSTGEYVIPANVVKAKGTEFFDKLLAQYKGGKNTDGD